MAPAQFDSEFDRSLTIAAIVATYVIGYEEGLPYLQRDAATTLHVTFTLEDLFGEGYSH
jgi:hypothetical protein